MRVFFPTYRAKIIGVRDVSKQTGLQGLGHQIVIPRAPSEPYPREANSPTRRMLGAMVIRPTPIIAHPTPFQSTGTGFHEIGGPIQSGVYPVVVAQPGAPAGQPVTPPPAVSTQSSPTPVVSIPAQPSTGAVLITSGGGTATPATSPIAPTVYATDQYGNIINAATGQVVMSQSLAAATGQTAASLTASTPAATPAATTASDITDQVAAWLSGTTSMFGYDVPNPVIVGVVVLGFAFLSGMGGKKR